MDPNFKETTNLLQLKQKMSRDVELEYQSIGDNEEENKENHDANKQDIEFAQQEVAPQEVTPQEVPNMLDVGAVRQMRELLNVDQPPIDQFLINGRIPRLVAALSDSASCDQLLIECAWVLAIISGGESDHSTAVMEAGAAPPLIRLIRHKRYMVAKMCMWALATIAASSARNRDELVKMEVVPAVLDALVRFRVNPVNLRLACRLVVSICRHSSDSYPLQQILLLLPAVQDLLSQCKDERCWITLCWAVAYASEKRHAVIESVIQLGIHGIICGILDSCRNAEVVIPCLRIFGNVTNGSEEQAYAVLRVDAAPLLMQLMEHDGDMVADWTMMAIGNIAGSSARNRDELVGMGVVKAVLDALARFRVNPVKLRLACRLVASICRHSSDSYPLQQILSLLRAVRDLLRNCEDERCWINLCWALAFASEMRHEVIESVIQLGIHGMVCKMLDSCRDGNAELLIPCLRIIGNVSNGTKEQADAVLQAGAIAVVGAHLTHTTPEVVNEACWVIGNVSAGTQSQLDLLIESGVMVKLLDVMRNGDYNNQKEAARTVSNVTRSPVAEHKRHLINHNIFAAIVPVLRRSFDNDLVIMLLDAVRELFECANTSGQLEQCLAQFRTAEGTRALISLTEHNLLYLARIPVDSRLFVPLSEDRQIYKKSYDLLRWL